MIEFINPVTPRKLTNDLRVIDSRARRAIMRSTKWFTLHSKNLPLRSVCPFLVRGTLSPGRGGFLFCVYAKAKVDFIVGTEVRTPDRYRDRARGT